MNQFVAGWLEAAAEILEEELACPVELLPGAAIAPGAASFTLAAEMAGGWEGGFAVTVDQSALEALYAAIRSDGADSEAASPAMAAGEARERWQRSFRRIAMGAAAALGARSGSACEVAMISPGEPPPDSAGMGYQLRAAGRMVALLLVDRVTAAAASPRSEVAPPAAEAEVRTATMPGAASDIADPSSASADFVEPAAPGRGWELLLDVELEASLRFGSREMALSDLLALGPGDVIQLDRALSDPVDLIVGDKIVARGEVVLVNGNFGLQVAEVAEPRKTLESIRCLF